MADRETLEGAGMQILNSHNLVHTFTVEHNGKKYTFSCRPQGIDATFRIVALAQRIFKEYGIDPNLDPVAKDLAYELATLEVSVVNRPPEFADFLHLPPEVDDWELIHKIYQEVATFLVSFRKDTPVPATDR